MVKLNFNNNNKERINNPHINYLFLWFTVIVILIGTVIGMFIIIQHLDENQDQQKSFANQETLIQNQKILQDIVSNIEHHEDYENTTMKKTFDIAINNSKKMDRMIEGLEELKSKP